MRIKAIIFFFLIPVIDYANSSEFNRYFISASGTAKPSVVNISAYEKKGRDTGGKLVRFLTARVLLFQNMVLSLQIIM